MKNSMKDSHAFALKAVAIWVVLCLPGNIVTLILVWRQDTSELEQNDSAVNITLPISENASLTASVDDALLIVNNDSTIIGEVAENASWIEPTLPINENVTCYELLEDYGPLRENARFWLEGVAISIVGVIGLAGNVLAVRILSHYTTNISFNRLLISLAVVDSLLIMDMIVQKAIIGNFVEDEPLWYKLTYPFFWHPIKGMIQSGAVFMVVAVSAERYRAVCHPLSKRQAPYKFILLVAAVSIALDIPRFMQFKLVDNYTDYWTTSIMENPVYIRFSSYWDELITTGIVPLLALIYFNMRIYLKIRSSAKFEYRFVGGNRQGTGKETAVSEAHQRTAFEKDDPDDKGASKSLIENQPTIVQITPNVGENLDPYEMRRLKGHRLSEGHLRFNGRSSTATRDRSVGEKWTEINQLPKGKEQMIFSTHDGCNKRRANDFTKVSSVSSMNYLSNECSSHAFRDRGPEVASYWSRFRNGGQHKKAQVTEPNCQFNGATSLPLLYERANNLMESMPDTLGDADEVLVQASTVTERKGSPQSAAIPLRHCGSETHKTLATGTFHFRKKREKSTVILVAIVFLFILCHSYRLALKIYEFAKPNAHIMDSFKYCYYQKRYHVPVAFYVLHNFHHLFLVFNSSVNFVIYCFVAKDFRTKLFQLLLSWLVPCRNRSSRMFNDSRAAVNITASPFVH